MVPAFARVGKGLQTALGIAMILCGQTSALAAEAPSYVWADSDGTVHTSKRLEAVAEPYLSIYRAQQTAYARGAPRGLPLPVSSPEGQRALWQGRVQAARAELLQATYAWAAVQAQAQAEGSNNPLLRLTPVVQNAQQSHHKALAEARARLLQARTALTITLPADALRAKVPSAWLQ